MKKFVCILALSTLLSTGAIFNADAASINTGSTTTRPDGSTNFNHGWTFNLGDIDGAEMPGFDNSAWRTLSLPHDWAIEGDFSEDNPSSAGGGALPGGIGWYRKTFTLPDNAEGKRTFIDFDGVYMNSSVYINGRYAGGRPYGYASFSIDATGFLNEGDNIVAVKVDNAEQPNSRWYSGCGIYRNVWLRHENEVCIPKDGTYITTDGDNIDIRATIENTTDAPRTVRMVTTVSDSKGKKLASKKTSVTVGCGSDTVIAATLRVKSPQLWSPGSPALYTVTTELFDSKGRQLDTDVTRTGFRTFRFDADKGFFLNGKHMKLNGVCLHHDAGALGAVVNRAAIRRQLTMLKDMGCNAIRCTHNPPAPELLDLCDEMGFLVMDEAFDMWRKRKTTYDYARYFNEWHERDLDDFIRRDRNHPSIIVWSIGNEVLEQWNDAGADTLSLAEANLILNFGHSPEQLAADDGTMSVNSLLTKKLADRVRALDPQRPVTAGCNEADPGNHLFRSGALDIIGFNYHDSWFAGVPQNFPGKPFVITESVSGLMTRGFYMMPSDQFYIWPDSWDRPFHHDSMSCSSYDNCYVPWGNYHEGTMKHVRDNDFISGQFVWTGFDYLGEPTPYQWPARSSYFGIIDLAGFPKDVYYLYQSEWQNDTDVLHLFPHWNWTEGEEVDIWAYYNNADEVELFLNGESLGTASKTPDRLHAVWRIPFAPGTLTAVSRRDGAEVARDTVTTAGTPRSLRLTPDRTVIDADGTDLCYLTVEVVDADGNLCPLADNEITFSVDGTAFNAGVDNGCQFSHERFKSDRRKAFYGKALLIAQNDGRAGRFTVTATSPGLNPASLSLASE